MQMGSFRKNETYLFFFESFGRPRRLVLGRGSSSESQDLIVPSEYER